MYQGDDFGFDFYLRHSDTKEVIDLTGYVARMQVRPSIGSSVKYVDIDSDDNPDKISIVDNCVIVTLNSALTSTLSFDEAVYDLELESPSDVVTTYLEGKIVLSKEVTR